MPKKYAFSEKYYFSKTNKLNGIAAGGASQTKRNWGGKKTDNR